jgi:hypothetical protein
MLIMKLYDMGVFGVILVIGLFFFAGSADKKIKEDTGVKQEQEKKPASATP